MGLPMSEATKPPVPHRVAYCSLISNFPTRHQQHPIHTIVDIIVPHRHPEAYTPKRNPPSKIGQAVAGDISGRACLDPDAAHPGAVGGEVAKVAREIVVMHLAMLSMLQPDGVAAAATAWCRGKRNHLHGILLDVYMVTVAQPEAVAPDLDHVMVQLEGGIVERAVLHVLQPEAVAQERAAGDDRIAPSSAHHVAAVEKVQACIAIVHRVFEDKKLVFVEVPDHDGHARW